MTAPCANAPRVHTLHVKAALPHRPRTKLGSLPRRLSRLSLVRPERSMTAPSKRSLTLLVSLPPRAKIPQRKEARSRKVLHLPVLQHALRRMVLQLTVMAWRAKILLQMGGMRLHALEPFAIQRIPVLNVLLHQPSVVTGAIAQKH